MGSVLAGPWFLVVNSKKHVINFGQLGIIDQKVESHQILNFSFKFLLDLLIFSMDLIVSEIQ